MTRRTLNSEKGYERPERRLTKLGGPRAAGSTRYGICDALRDLHTYRMPFARNNGGTHLVIGVVALVIGTTLFPKDIKYHPWEKLMPKVAFR